MSCGDCGYLTVLGAFARRLILCHNAIVHNEIPPMRVSILLGSSSDTAFAQKIVDELARFDISSDMTVASAHKAPEKVIDIVRKNNEQSEPLVYVTIAGRSNGLSGVVAGSSVHPVIACPPFIDKSDYLVNIHSTLQMPSDTPVLTVLEPANVALSIARIFALSDAKMREKVAARLASVKDSFR